MIHGGNVRVYREVWGIDEQRLADFSANINPLGPPEGVRAAVWSALDRIRHYPDPRQEQFRREVARHWSVPEETVIAGNGAAELIFLLMGVWRPRRILTVAPSFTEYEEAASAVGARILRVPLHPEQGFVPDAEKIVGALHASGADLLALANPNNPTGVLFEPAQLERLLDEAEQKGIRVLLDEAFLDFCTEERQLSRIGRAARSEGLFVLRSMTKFYSIPGLRLGYGVSSPGVVKEMDRLRPPWAVNELALAAGVAALGETRFAAETRRWMETERARMERELARLGFETARSRANFLLAWRDGFDIARVWPYLAAKGIFVRDCRSFAGLDARFFRVAVRPRDEQERLFAALKDWLQDHD
ncbi:MAG: threonine-phosphate decarboxylase [Alicyclobacillaceae bacterium]|nr:threonine-phosphate decarboxylase [Alicyclobacillaceae bacterium]